MLNANKFALHSYARLAEPSRIEGLVPIGEQLEMGAIPRAIGVEQHQPRFVLLWFIAELAANTAGCLDVFGGSFGLVEHHHQAKARDLGEQGLDLGLCPSHGGGGGNDLGRR